jgi:hypothetical protein
MSRRTLSIIAAILVAFGIAVGVMWQTAVDESGLTPIPIFPDEGAWSGELPGAGRWQIRLAGDRAELQSASGTIQARVRRTAPMDIVIELPAAHPVLGRTIACSILVDGAISYNGAQEQTRLEPSDH